MLLFSAFLVISSWSKEGTVRHCQSKEASILGHTMRKQGSCLKKEIMPGACKWGRSRTVWMDNINTWTYSLWRVNQNDRGQRQMEKVRPWCGQPSDRGRLKNRTVILFRATESNFLSACVAGNTRWFARAISESVESALQVSRILAADRSRCRLDKGATTHFWRRHWSQVPGKLCQALLPRSFVHSFIIAGRGPAYSGPQHWDLYVGPMH